MLTNTTITIFNQFPDRKQNKMIFVPHVIPEVWFHKDQKSSVKGNGLESADEYKIRIPFSLCSEWVPEHEFNSLEESGNKWTVQNGDLFIVGEWRGGNITRIKDIKKEFSGEIGQVLSHSENFFGSSKHIRIGGGGSV